MTKDTVLRFTGLSTMKEVISMNLKGRNPVLQLKAFNGVRKDILLSTALQIILCQPWH